ncbi:ankyrin repeat-containing domain protein [Russula ochroleuca]|uniref:Ankyrin repeat-containing domain protein n=1 Tax=Russula ochroleuca TaxID=152965 RepID=A0A9P5N1A3_9AGAM|nr:ankyrin repeat-containing domain protein [Russula ochroleuca]
MGEPVEAVAEVVLVVALWWRGSGEGGADADGARRRYTWQSSRHRSRDADVEGQFQGKSSNIEPNWWFSSGRFRRGRGNISKLSLQWWSPAAAAGTRDVSYDLNRPVLNRTSKDGQAEVVYPLLRHNADVNARGISNWMPLRRASLFGHTKVVQLLLDHGADINALSRGYNTPLHLVVAEGSFDVVWLLLEHGADADILEGGNQTPYQVAESAGLAEIAQLLLEHGARRRDRRVWYYTTLCMGIEAD